MVFRNSLTAQKVSKYRDFSGPYLVRLQEITGQKKLRILTLFTHSVSITVTLADFCFKKLPIISINIIRASHNVFLLQLN